MIRWWELCITKTSHPDNKIAILAEFGTNCFDIYVLFSNLTKIFHPKLVAWTPLQIGCLYMLVQSRQVVSSATLIYVLPPPPFPIKIWDWARGLITRWGQLLEYIQKVMMWNVSSIRNALQTLKINRPTGGKNFALIQIKKYGQKMSLVFPMFHSLNQHNATDSMQQMKQRFSIAHFRM